ncbi:Hint domain-containing protein [Pseudotabrizicola sp.]|uniref:Hint domain-containing protein n=1 Tax=Pseudotabrizicola sp. TaxID=2939647 RepID=UPI00271D0805|nr:Hint domain-containing protein [Pseudotabrizicola sp.]MDO8885001.1 Hint domain-containing protein [Pseudotabrizicola sp.]
MAIYTDQFFVLDPGNPPVSGTELTMVLFDIDDIDNNNFIQTGSGDTVDGFVVTAVWVNDTITVVMDGVTVTITGVTFYLEGGPAVFTPTDGTVLSNATFVSSTFVTASTEIPVGSFGPPCYAAGTLIETATGLRLVEDLQEGDMVITLDHGLQPIRWIGRRTVSGLEDWAPIRFMTGTMGNDRPLLVSPQHRMLVQGWKAELYFGQSEVLVAAKHLVNGDTIHCQPMDRVTYMHLLFDQHQLIFAEGAVSESLLPGDEMLRGNPAMQREILYLFPELRLSDACNGWEPARPLAQGRESRVLRVA